MSTCRGDEPESGCTRKSASATRCRATTISMPTCTPIEGAGIAGDDKGYLFRTARGRTRQLSTEPMSQPDAYRMIVRRTRAAGIWTRIGNHSFRATGTTEYLMNGGQARERAANGRARELAHYWPL